MSRFQRFLDLGYLIGSLFKTAIVKFNPAAYNSQQVKLGEGYPNHWSFDARTWRNETSLHPIHWSSQGACPPMSSLSNQPDTQSLPTENSEFTSAQPACCRWARLAAPGAIIAVLGVVTVLAICTAAYFAGRANALASDGSAVGHRQWVDSLPLIDAATAATSDKFSIATGPVSQEAEGLFVLDHNSGLLQCHVMYPRVAAFRAQFNINVADALGAGGKGGGYMMVTGGVDFPRSSNRPAAQGVVYVMDTASGNFVCYGIPFDQTSVPNNRPQQGTLVLLHQGSANPVIDRDKLR